MQPAVARAEETRTEDNNSPLVHGDVININTEKRDCQARFEKNGIAVNEFTHADLVRH